MRLMAHAFGSLLKEGTPIIQFGARIPYPFHGHCPELNSPAAFMHSCRLVSMLSTNPLCHQPPRSLCFVSSSNMSSPMACVMPLSTDRAQVYFAEEAASAAAGQGA
jgi:hypothetical protein